MPALVAVRQAVERWLGFRLGREGLNPANENVALYNNIWADPTGTMGAPAGGTSSSFSAGAPADTVGLVLDSNLYWNGGLPVPTGEQVNPTLDDPSRIVGQPGLPTDHSALVLPRWTGSSFANGHVRIRQEFQRLAGLYGSIPVTSKAVDTALEAQAPTDDILQRPRPAPDRGAYEASLRPPRPR